MERLAHWCMSWDWSENEEQYDSLLVDLFFKEPLYCTWFNGIAKMQPFLDFKLALYSAIRLHMFSQILDLPADDTNEFVMTAMTNNMNKTLMTDWLEYAHALHPSYFSSDSKPPRSYVEDVLDKAIQHHQLSVTQYHRAKTAIALLHTMDNEPTATEVLNVIIQSIEPVQQPFALPANL